MNFLKIRTDFKIFLSVKTVSQWADYEKMNRETQMIWDSHSRFWAEGTNKSSDELFNKTSLIPEFNKIVVISMGIFNPNNKFEITHYCSDNEIELLQKFTKEITLEKYRKYLIVTFNGFKLDFQFIAKRLLINKIRIPEAFNIFGLQAWNYPEKLFDLHYWWKAGGYGYVDFELLAINFGINIYDLCDNANFIQSLYYSNNSDFYSIEHEKDLNQIKDINKNILEVLAKIIIAMKRERVTYIYK